MKYPEIVNEVSLMALRDAAFTANREYGEIINSETDTAEKDRRSAVVTDRVKKYNDACMKHVFKVWLDSEKPMKSALLDGVFPVLKKQVKGKTGAQTVSLEDSTRIFTVTDFIQYATEIGRVNPANDPAWLKQAEEFVEVGQRVACCQ